MPIAYYQLHPANMAQPGYVVAKDLSVQTAVQFGAVAGMGVGIGAGSCRAALAVVPDGNFPAAQALANVGPPPGPLTLPVPVWAPPPPLPYGIAFGNSQLAAGGLVLGPIGAHAERASLTAGGVAPPALYVLPGTNNAVLFVELTPCANCQAWLNGAPGAGVPNPYNGIINTGGPTTLNVWWRWEYPGPGLPPGPPPMGGVVALGGIAEMNLWHSWEWVWPGQVIDINTNW